MTADLLLAIDEGTSSARAIVYDGSWTPIATAARRLATLHPRPAWAEQDPEEIRGAVVQTVAQGVDPAGGPGRIAATGIANQGETVVAGDSRSGEPLAPAVLWSCR